MNGISKLIIIIVLLAFGILGYFFYKNSSESISNNSTTTSTSTSTSTVPKSTSKIYYQNNEYGFIFSLPDSWVDYSIIEDEWDGDSLDANGNLEESTVIGPLVSIRHPDWDYKAPRQDVPIMVFTLQQWNDMQADKFHIGAAPINPSEIGRNKKYVFAIPARYNFSYLTGYEEVDQLIRGDSLQAF